ncbi:MAG: nuclear transport factor 2 family protein [Alphaproteobacteria bacterium]|nr:nuclear transport factor 2 family protein [Alphaproteobacteria bacterium]
MATLSLDTLYTGLLSATSLTGEAADRFAIQDLINGWAHYADRRLPEKQAALFTSDGVVSIYMGDPEKTQPVSILRGAAELIPALGDLHKFSQTTHMNGQSTVVVRGDRAVGESYCFAHQISEEGGQRKLQILAIRYYDDFMRQGDHWLFAQRKLIIDWSETRQLAA